MVTFVIDSWGVEEKSTYTLNCVDHYNLDQQGCKKLKIYSLCSIFINYFFVISAKAWHAIRCPLARCTTDFGTLLARKLVMLEKRITFINRTLPANSNMVHLKANPPPSHYRAYLVRLWQDNPGGNWRASAQSAQTGEKILFADLTKLVAFLYAQTDVDQPTPPESASFSVPTPEPRSDENRC
jgi:hypothetical protein